MWQRGRQPWVRGTRVESSSPAPRLPVLEQGAFGGEADGPSVQPGSGRCRLGLELRTALPVPRVQHSPGGRPSGSGA